MDAGWAPPQVDLRTPAVGALEEVRLDRVQAHDTPLAGDLHRDVGHLGPGTPDLVGAQAPLEVGSEEPRGRRRRCSGLRDGAGGCLARRCGGPFTRGCGGPFTGKRGGSFTRGRGGAFAGPSLDHGKVTAEVQSVEQQVEAHDGAREGGDFDLALQRRVVDPQTRRAHDGGPGVPGDARCEGHPAERPGVGREQRLAGEGLQEGPQVGLAGFERGAVTKRAFWPLQHGRGLGLDPRQDQLQRSRPDGLAGEVGVQLPRGLEVDPFVGESGPRRVRRYLQVAHPVLAAVRVGVHPRLHLEPAPQPGGGVASRQGQGEGDGAPRRDCARPKVHALHLHATAGRLVGPGQAAFPQAHSRDRQGEGQGGRAHVGFAPGTPG